MQQQLGHVNWCGPGGLGEMHRPSESQDLTEPLPVQYKQGTGRPPEAEENTWKKQTAWNVWLELTLQQELLEVEVHRHF